MALNVGIFSFESTFASTAKNTPMCHSVTYMLLMKNREISNTFLIIINLGCLDHRGASFFTYLLTLKVSFYCHFLFPSAVRNSTIRRFHAISSFSEQIRLLTSSDKRKRKILTLYLSFNLCFADTHLPRYLSK